jgi:D-amino-acid oxidase
MRVLIATFAHIRGQTETRQNPRHPQLAGCLPGGALAGQPDQARAGGRSAPRWPNPSAVSWRMGLTAGSCRRERYGRSMSSRELEVVVIGAGVSGLTTAICLAEAGLAVGVHAAAPPQATTSAAAGALWGPHLVGMDERVVRWTTVTLARLLEMLDNPATGVRLLAGIDASRNSRQDPPDWISTVDGQPPQPAGPVPAGYATGWRFKAPVVDMPVYLGYLLARLQQTCAEFRDDCAFGSLAEAIEQTSARVIVNCSGIGAHHLVPDATVTAVRGQVVAVANPGISEFFVGTGDDPGDLTYLFPHRDTVILGGTEQPGNWSTKPDPATAAQIMRNCAAIEPSLAGAPVVAHRVGLRPVRPSVRLEAEDIGGGRRLLHNYGHGGAGITLSWGCALDIAAAVTG